MCLVVEYSEKLVKSDYLGVIICIWWRKVQKIGIFANQNAKYTTNSYEDPKKRDLPHKITQFKHFSSRIHQKIRTFVVIFLENWKTHKTWYTTNPKSNNLQWRNSKNRKFSAKR